jgi:hypothetical protein
VLARAATRHMASGKDIKFGKQGRALVLQGVDLLADAVQVLYNISKGCMCPRHCMLCTCIAVRWIDVLQCCGTIC